MKVQVLRSPGGGLAYLRYSPREERADAHLPLIVFLHGRGERGTDPMEVRRYGLPAYLDAGNDLPAVVLAPQCPPGRHWGHVVEDLDSLVEDTLGDPHLSAPRIVLTGFSMGGFGAWYWARREPWRFAALAPVGGSGSPWQDDRRIIDPCTLRHLPIWIFHGVRDAIIDVAGADEAVARLRECGAAVRYTRYEDADHMQSCHRAYEDPELYRWMLEAVNGGEPDDR